jgi:biopolymer transport protein ExbD
LAKETNEELNLTPFIGLFAMLVVLLLVTAVWNTVEVLPTNTSNSTANSNPSPQPPDNKPKLDLSVTVLVDKIQVSVNTKPYYFEFVGGEIVETRLVPYLESLKRSYPEKNDVVLYTDNRVPYKHLVQTFDLLIGAGFPDVGVSTQ